MRIYLSHSSNFDYRGDLYEPLKQHLPHKYSVFYPHDSENINVKSKDIIVTSDYVVAEVSHPSTGQGIELGWADAQGVRIICIHRSGRDFSRSLRFVSKDFIEYESIGELIIKLEKILK